MRLKVREESKEMNAEASASLSKSATHDRHSLCECKLGRLRCRRVGRGIVHKQLTPILK
jgi:hypothetical protein